jgi:hypothetical protein
MFAVVVLGIGFIMVAAIFPVAIKQSQLNTEETVAIAVARNGLGVVTELATGTNPLYVPQPVGSTESSALLVPTDVPATINDPVGELELNEKAIFGKFFSFKDRRLMNQGGTLNFDRRDGMWKAIAGNMVQPGDPRYAWVPLYRRDMIYSHTVAGPQRMPFPFAQVIMIGCTVRNRTTYETHDYISPPPAADQPLRDTQFYPLEPKPVAVRIEPINAADPNSEMAITFFSVRNLAPGHGFPTGGQMNAVYDRIAAEAVGEGSFVVISDDRIRGSDGTTPSANTGRMNGKIYRVGTKLDDPQPGFYRWTLQPGFDFIPDPGYDGKFDAGGGGGDDDDINRVGVDSVADWAFGGQNTNGADVKVVGSGAQKGAVAYVIGKGFTVADPNNPLPPGASPSAQYEGTTQDVAVYTTFVPVR